MYWFIILILIYIIYKLSNKTVYVWDWAWIHKANPYIIIKPTHINQIIHVITNSYLPICVAGTKYSHGGQTMLEKSIYIDMCFYNKIINLDQENKWIRVQAGCTWKQIQIYLDEFDL